MTGSRSAATVQGRYDPLTPRELNAQTSRTTVHDRAFSPLPIEESTPGPPDVHPKFGKITRRWRYDERDGSFAGYVCRFETKGGKVFRPLRYGRITGRAGWFWKGWGHVDRRPLFRLPEILTRPDVPILICEGEKTADRAGDLFPDMVATTPMNGAQSPKLTDWSVLSGRHVLIAPDLDEAGVRFCNAVAGLCRRAGAASICNLDVHAIAYAVTGPGADLPKGFDLADLPKECTAEKLRQMAPADRWISHLGEAHGIAAADPVGPDDETLQRYLRLSPLERERQRQSTAAILGLGVTALDRLIRQLRNASPSSNGVLDLPEPEPHPEPQDGALVLNDLAAFLERHVVLVRGAADALALWIVLSYVYEAFEICPRLAITSPVKRCGKTLVLDLLQSLVQRPLSSSNCTAATLFRAVEAMRPTLLIDEADTFINGKDELRGIINSGHRRNAAYVLRTAAVRVDGGVKHELQLFSTWGPVAIAAIGNLPGTIMDRAIHIQMQRRGRRNDVQRFDRHARAEAANLAQRVARFAQDAGPEVAQVQQPKLPFLHDRASDNWEPLLAIAAAAAGNWPERARRAARALEDDDNESSDIDTMLLTDLRIVFDRVDGNFVASRELVTCLVHGDDFADRPWQTARNGNPIDENWIARRLRPFRICSKQRRQGENVRRGFRRVDFMDAWHRYLPEGTALEPVTPVTALQTIKISTAEPVADSPSVTTFNGHERPMDAELSRVSRAEQAKWSGSPRGDGDI